ncbi:LysR family transcriptional regulator [Roseobacter sp. YSTF-M11]|uniref:LysR family transcriptional regulator n=1 Tax=Roseobacter insulae TaxID=2859783 RepID=A0A9X1G0D8_9RHOB|nr:LysR family transcriptional regulator [Roseobacter insulae]MBW4710213.1 LysR family transcriptional regulator [Roseobacter insulae]
MHRSNLSLKSLEIFRETARAGHVQSVARDSGLSIGTVSHHLSKLESTLGVRLLDHTRRPMVLTAEGTAFLGYIEQALALLHKAETEALSGRLSDVRSLRLALIEDFDSQIAPELATLLAKVMPSCAFTHLTRPSHEILSLLSGRSVDVGIATQPQTDPDGLRAHPLLRDPFVLALPMGASMDPDSYINGQTALPFLRYSDEQIIGGQITAHLRRLRIDLPGRFQFESNQSLMGMIAEGTGWAITTPTNFIRASRFRDRIRLLPFPGKEFARYISVFTRTDFAPATSRVIWTSMRSLIDQHMVMPATHGLPWLRGKLTLLDAPEISSES